MFSPHRQLASQLAYDALRIAAANVTAKGVHTVSTEYKWAADTTAWSKNMWDINAVTAPH